MSEKGEKFSDKFFFGVTFPKRGERKRLSSMQKQDRDLSRGIKQAEKQPKKKYRLYQGDDRNYPYAVGVGKTSSELPKEWK